MFAKQLKAWRGKRSLKEAAAALDVDYPSYRKWETGKRTPAKLSLCELERRMAAKPENNK
jgi:transcriptional regulator with XRE-family HTH domain